MKSLILNAVSVAVLIAVIGMASLEGASAQTTSLAKQENMQGKVVEIPYITYRDFQSSSLKGEAALSETQRTDTSGFLNGKTVHELLSVSSLDEAIQFLGEPRTIEKENFSDGDWVATLRYDEGTFFDYRKYKDGALALLEFELWTSPWSLKVGGARLRPGMRTDRLSVAVRQSIREGSYPEGADVDGIGAIAIAKADSREGEDTELVQDGKAQITVHVNSKTDTVEIVRFTRLGPW